ncbi:uncharacterized protein BDZ99DRAFT_297926 [Mytilinidion resinicola]|uniref:Single-strand DNA deaminase toxin A-like C-terminal domain-containing protein n=1 Tax=Mytilinidion resinicola TaxID=574789 RepID=A0A6A6YT45_9PEZI|nr:uncharacterized protein BDZ99DRAFT_297926 [Mytilinidion resinicola]KAF2811204.1 hypothetical protein BDZ99DRAFT_297926 [Mytilinidion resinicola]
MELALRNEADYRKTFLTPPKESDPRKLSFQRAPVESTTTIALTREGARCLKSVTFQVSREKAVTILLRGGPFEPIAAMSGRSHRAHDSFISGEEWTEKALQLAEIVGHIFTISDYDRRKPRSFQASHAETQLIAWYIDHRAFLPRDRVPDTELDCKIEFTERKSKDEEERGEARRLWEKDICFYSWQREMHQKLIAMSENAPPVCLTKATIIVSAYGREICDDCKKFVKRLNSCFRLSIELIERTRPKPLKRHVGFADESDSDTST